MKKVDGKSDHSDLDLHEDFESDEEQASVLDDSKRRLLPALSSKLSSSAKKAMRVAESESDLPHTFETDMEVCSFFFAFVNLLVCLCVKLL